MADTNGADDGHRARLVGINHVACEVGDIDQALQFYGSLLVFDLRSRSETKAFVDAGDQFIALAETDDAGETIDAERHFGLAVDDAARVERRLEERGVEPLEKPGFEFHDPWGNRIQIVDYEEIQFTKADHVLQGMGLADIEKSEDALTELAATGLASDDTE